MSVPDGRVAAPVWDALAKIEVSGHPSPHCEMRPATPGASSPITEAWSASDIQPSFSPWRAGPSGWGAAWWGAAVRSCHGTVQIQQMLHRHEPDCAIRKHLSYDVQLPPDAYLRPIPIVTCRGARVRGSKAEKGGLPNRGALQPGVRAGGRSAGRQKRRARLITNAVLNGVIRQ